MARAPGFFRDFAACERASAFVQEFGRRGVVWVVSDASAAYPAVLVAREHARNATDRNPLVREWLDGKHPGRLVVQYLEPTIAERPIDVVDKVSCKQWAPPFPGCLGGLQAAEDAALEVLVAARPSVARRAAGLSLGADAISAWWARHGVRGVDVTRLTGQSPNAVADALWTGKAGPAQAAAPEPPGASATAPAAGAARAGIPAAGRAGASSSTALAAAAWKASPIPKPLPPKRSAADGVRAILAAGGMVLPGPADPERPSPSLATSPSPLDAGAEPGPGLAAGTTDTEAVCRWIFAAAWCLGGVPAGSVEAAPSALRSGGLGAVGTSLPLSVRLSGKQNAPALVRARRGIAQAIFAADWRLGLCERMRELEGAASADHEGQRRREEADAARRAAEDEADAAATRFVVGEEAEALASAGPRDVRAGDVVEVTGKKVAVGVVVSVGGSGGDAVMELASGQVVHARQLVRRGLRHHERRAAGLGSAGEGAGAAAGEAADEDEDAAVAVVEPQGDQAGGSDAPGALVYVPERLAAAPRYRLVRLFAGGALRVALPLGEMDVVPSRAAGREILSLRSSQLRRLVRSASGAEAAAVAALGEAGTFDNLASLRGMLQVGEAEARDELRRAAEAAGAQAAAAAATAAAGPAGTPSEARPELPGAPAGPEVPPASAGGRSERAATGRARRPADRRGGGSSSMAGDGSGGSSAAAVAGRRPGKRAGAGTEGRAGKRARGPG